MALSGGYRNVFNMNYAKHNLKETSQRERVGNQMPFPKKLTNYTHT